MVAQAMTERQGQEQMTQITNWYRSSDEEGQAVVEYAILLAFILVGALVFLPGLQTAVMTMYQGVRDALDAVL
jgi:Flp pilus assembly pilin Flp